MKISLSLAAKLISETSGYPMNRDALRNQILHGRWPHKLYLVDSRKMRHKIFLVEHDDVIQYAKTFRGLSAGRPWPKKKGINERIEADLEEMYRIAKIT